LSISHDDALIQQNRARVHHPDARPIMMIRRQRGEAPFGYFKQFGGLGRLTGHGLTFATKKALIAGIGWNLRKLLKVALPVSARLAALWGLRWLYVVCCEAMSGAFGKHIDRAPLQALKIKNSGWPVKKRALSAGC